MDHNFEIKTLVFMFTAENELCADIYVPFNIVQGEKRPIALLIHGGSNVMFTRREVNVKQVELLIADGFLPVSCDYRLCPELNILDGPMNDVCGALCWARFQLPSLAPGIALGLQADGDKVVAVGWATGGHLAMTLAFTAPKKGLSAPEAILAFHCPTDYEDDWWKTPRFPEGNPSFPHETGDVLRGIQSKPIVGHNPLVEDSLSPADPRYRFVLHMARSGQTVPFLLNGPTYSYASTVQPSQSDIASISPYAQILTGSYRTPTFLIHGNLEKTIPWQQSVRTVEALRAEGVEADIEIVAGAGLYFHWYPESSLGAESVKRGYAWLRKFV